MFKYLTFKNESQNFFTLILKKKLYPAFWTVKMHNINMSMFFKLEKYSATPRSCNYSMNGELSWHFVCFIIF